MPKAVPEDASLTVQLMRAFRDKHKLNQTQAAALMGLSRQFWSDIESMKTEPPTIFVQALRTVIREMGEEAA